MRSAALFFILLIALPRASLALLSAYEIPISRKKVTASSARALVPELPSGIPGSALAILLRDRIVVTDASDNTGNSFDLGKYGETLISLVHYKSWQTLH